MGGFPGYKNVRSKEGAYIVPDEERAPGIRRAFERIATGLYKQTDVLGIVTAEGLTTIHGIAPAGSKSPIRGRLGLFAGGWHTVLTVRFSVR